MPLELKKKLYEFRYLILAGSFSALGSLPAFFAPDIPGYDSSSHVAKTAFLLYSFAHGNFSGWSQFWYSGFQLFYTYSPLTYVMAAVFGWPFGSAMVGMRILIGLSFFLSGAGAFALARDFGISEKWSVLPALLYSLTSPHILTLFFVGSLTYALAFALAPFLFLSLRIALRNQSLGATISLGTLIGLFIISNQTTVYVILFPMLAYFLISLRWARPIKPILVIIGASLIGLLLSAFWLIPYVKIDLSGQYNLLSESSSGTYPSSTIIHWYSFFIPSFGNTNAGDLGWILLLPALASIVFLKKRDEFALYGAGVVIVLLTVGPSLTPLFYKIPLVLALQFGWRFLIGDVIFLTPLSGLFFYHLSQRFPSHALTQRSQRIIAALSILAIIVTVSIVVLLIPNLYYGDLTRQTPADPNQESAFNFLSNQPGFFRVMVIDRYYEAFPEYTLKGSIDGWYDQATTQAYGTFRFAVYYCGATNSTLNALRLLGVRYVMIDYGYGGDATAELKSYESPDSPFGGAIYNNSEVTIFQVPNSQLVYVSNSIPNNQYSLSQTQSCNQPIPSAPTDQINYSISNMTWGETRISFEINVNQSVYVLVSNSYSSGWMATDNGSSIPIQISPPGLPVLHLSKGISDIELYYSGAPEARNTAILSLSILVGIVVGIPAWNSARARYRHQAKK